MDEVTAFNSTSTPDTLSSQDWFIVVVIALIVIVLIIFTVAIIFCVRCLLRRGRKRTPSRENSTSEISREEEHRVVITINNNGFSNVGIEDSPKMVRAEVTRSSRDSISRFQQGSLVTSSKSATNVNVNFMSAPSNVDTADFTGSNMSLGGFSSGLAPKSILRTVAYGTASKQTRFDDNNVEYASQHFVNEHLGIHTSFSDDEDEGIHKYQRDPEPKTAPKRQLTPKTKRKVDDSDILQSAQGTYIPKPVTGLPKYMWRYYYTGNKSLPKKKKGGAVQIVKDTEFTWDSFI